MNSQGREMAEVDHSGVEHETENAVLFKMDEEKLWIPKSILGDYDDRILEVEEWFAIQEGLV